MTLSRRSDNSKQTLFNKSGLCFVNRKRKAANSECVCKNARFVSVCCEINVDAICCIDGQAVQSNCKQHYLHATVIENKSIISFKVRSICEQSLCLCEAATRWLKANQSNCIKFKARKVIVKKNHWIRWKCPKDFKQTHVLATA